MARHSRTPTEATEHSFWLAYFSGFRGPLIALLLVSIIANLPMLVGPLFMLQIYDRVLISRSLPTLAVLFALVVVLYVVYGISEAIRSRIMVRIAAISDDSLTDLTLRQIIRDASRPNTSGLSNPVRDAESVRIFVAGPGPLAIIDLPWTPLYLLLVYRLHAQLGHLALVGLVIVIILTIINERVQRGPAEALSKHQRSRDNAMRDIIANSDAIAAMGMQTNIAGRWRRKAHHYTGAFLSSTDRGTSLNSATKAFRLLLQSAVLALGAVLVIRGELSAGVMIAASIITSRALAPIEQLVGAWRPLLSARRAARNLAQTQRLDKLEQTTLTELPLPSARFDARDVAVSPQRQPPQSSVT